MTKEQWGTLWHVFRWWRRAEGTLQALCRVAWESRTNVLALGRVIPYARSDRPAIDTWTRRDWQRIGYHAFARAGEADLQSCIAAVKYLRPDPAIHQPIVDDLTIGANRARKNL